MFEPLTSVKAGDDFYKYVNGRWLQAQSIPRFRSSFGVSEEVELIIEKHLFTLFQKSYAFSEKGGKPQTKGEKMMDAIGRLGMSAMRPEKQTHSITFLKGVLRDLYCVRDTVDIATNIGLFNKRGVKTLLEINVFQKLKQGNKFSIVLSPGRLGLPGPSYYNATAPGKSRTLFSYVKLCKEVSKLLDVDDLSSAISTEGILAMNLDKFKDDTYEDIHGSELEKRFTTIPWDILFESYGTADHGWKDLIIRVYSPRWFHFLQTCIKTWEMKTWSRLFSLQTVLHALPLLPPPYDTLHFELFGRQLRGEVEKLPQNLLAMNICRKLLFIPLSYLYIQDYIDESLKDSVDKFVLNIRNHAVKRLEGLTWLEESTRKTGAEKIQKMHFGISHPDKLPDIEIPDLNTENFLQNVYLLETMNKEMNQTRVYKKEFLDPNVFWDEPPYTVNAYYYNETNQFILPAGTLQFPFYTMKSGSLGWNYGGLGAIIGHEMTHAFDVDGKEYTAEGEKKQWWTRKDNLHYNKKTRELISLFSSGLIHKHRVDGSLTLSENIADLGGLGIALDALHHELKGATEEEKKKQLRDFFTSFAVSWRVKERPRKAIQSLFLDVHAPAELRVNYIVPHFKDWYETFGVQTGDDLYIPPEERIEIF